LRSEFESDLKITDIGIFRRLAKNRTEYGDRIFLHSFLAA